jgi:hypothetical protein
MACAAPRIRVGWPAPPQASLTAAITIPMTTRTTTAACIQIQVGDIGPNPI